ncbi:Crp/Fnr family transcriptional regulator [uncultured Winogradskyella sp.]|uniref:Crp/Fnr family transcriptional regulator n=1 Tax=uncultured Winogradskyella sp. TaxID=395353 RepID=UPI00260E1C72|nr:Crp/Fnr family transcriptional regulator [uncultured Winogradskyella sp.]
MSIYKGILDHIARYVKLSDNEIKEFISILKTTRVKKRQFIVQPGFVSEYRNYIVEGAVRVFYLDDSGKEHTIIIAIEDWFFTDFYSYLNRTPAEYYAEALEDSLILQMKYDDVEELCARIHSISEYFRLFTERSMAHSYKRTISNISKTSEERYWEYVNKYPQIANRVPQYVLASYLGISPESISRIRSRS